MKKSKKILCLLLAVFSCVCFSACSDDENENDNDTKKESGAYRVVIDMEGNDLSFFGVMTAVNGVMYDGETDEALGSAKQFAIENINGHKQLVVYTDETCLSFSVAFTVSGGLENEEPFTCSMKFYNGDELEKECNEVSKNNSISINYAHVNSY